MEQEDYEGKVVGDAPRLILASDGVTVIAGMNMTGKTRLLSEVGDIAASEGATVVSWSPRTGCTASDPADVGGRSCPGFWEAVGPVLATVPRNRPPSGADLFTAVCGRLSDGTLRDGSVLILDCPESGLHPAWIGPLSRALTSLAAEVGVRVVLTTHSPHLMMCLEHVTSVQGVPIAFLHLLRGEDGTVAVYDVSGDPVPIYNEFSIPITEAASAFWDY